MRITSITVRGFRNISGLRLSPAEHLTVVVGQNGQGKTNLLEAIFYLATLKPLRAGKLEELVGWGLEACRVKGSVLERIERELEVTVRSSRRTATLDAKRPASVEAYGEVLKVVSFTPDDLQIVKGSASSRRRWIDRATFTRSSSYLSEHRRFDRALRARNKLLKEARDTGRTPSELAAFDEAVAQTGARVRRRRMDLLRELEELVAERFETISRSGLALRTGYRGEMVSVEGSNEGEGIDEGLLVERLRAGLAKSRQKDLARGFTSAGPQSDDVYIGLSAREARVFASQGQQRAIVLALKIAEIENLRDRLGRTPVLLLDDVSSELDPARNAHLIGYLSSFPGQAFVTTTDPGLAPEAAGSSMRIYMHEGRAGTEEGESMEIPSLAKGFQ